MFPEQIKETISQALEAHDSIKAAPVRKLRDDDPNQIVCITSHRWRPDERCIGQLRPEISHYLIHLNTYVKSASDDEAERVINEINRHIRELVYTVPGLRDDLQGLKETGAIQDPERVTKFEVIDQQGDSVEGDGEFAHYSVTILKVDVE